MEGGIFLTIKDLQFLLGCESYKTANVAHQAIRDALQKKTIHITIKEYCEYEGIDFKYVWDILRGNRAK